MRGRAPSLVLAIALGLTGAARADAIDDYVEAEMHRQAIPGVALGLILKGQAVKLRGYGFANLEHQVSVSDETLFQSGSIGKAFTAMAIMLLVEDGTLTLDDSIHTWLPDAPASWRSITLRHLLNHTSGLGYWDVDEQDDYSDAELLRHAFAAPLAFSPGQRFEYNNMGYALLGLLIKQVTGTHYGQVLRDRVFQPLNMPTARVISDADIIKQRASGYELTPDGLKNQSWVSPTFNATADGALYLSLRDYLQWERGLSERRLLSTDAWTQVFKPTSLRDGTSSGYGFGWQIEPIQSPTRFSHSGGWQGFSTYIQRDEKSGLTIVVLANRDRVDTGALATRIEQLFMNP